MSTSEKRNSRLTLFGRHTGLLALAVLGTLLSAKIWVPVVFFIVDTFPENPALAGAILFIICVVFVLCIFGAGMRPRAVGVLSRVILLFLSVVAAVASMEAISFGLISVTVTASREGFLWLSIAIALVACAAWGLKTALDWRLSYWIAFPAVFATLILATFSTSLVDLL
jgi:hypothetical protein